jgi:iron complex transport system substrate-binding protein
MTDRIVSLLASGTEILDVLGVGHRLVGISHECDFPPALLDRPRLSRPRFDPAGMESAAIDRAVRQALTDHGSVYELDAETLARLDPALILTQAVCEVCAVPTPGVQDMVRGLGLSAKIVSLDAHTLADILATIRQVGAAAGEPARGERVAALLEARLTAVRDAVADAARPRVLAMEWLDPPFLPGHWVPEMIEVAGGACVAGVAGEPSVETGWDALRGVDPDVLLIMPCGYGLEASRRDADRYARQLMNVGARAVENGRSFVVDGSSYFNRSGPRAVDGVEILGGLLHPDRWPAPRAEAASVWRPGEIATGDGPLR